MQNKHKGSKLFHETTLSFFYFCFSWDNQKKAQIFFPEYTLFNLL